VDLSQVYAYLVEGQWFRQVSQVGTVSLGRQTCGLGVAWRGESVDITFDPEDEHLIFHLALPFTWDEWRVIRL